MVVNHVQNHSQTQPVRFVHEAPHIVGLTVDGNGGEKPHAVVTPSETSRKIVHRHYFNQSDAE